MIMILKLKKPSVFLTLALSFCCSGCGMVSVIGSPNPGETKVPAEFKFAEHENRKILILVDQPGWLNAQVNLRYHLTNAIAKMLIETIKIKPENFIAYSKLVDFRSSRSDFSLLSPARVGRELNADIVLSVNIEDSQLTQMPEREYYTASLDVRAALFDTVTEQRLWPEALESKRVRVGFEVESRGLDAAVSRLTSASAYCIVRYFYDCPRNKFKIADDRSAVEWGEW